MQLGSIFGGQRPKGVEYLYLVVSVIGLSLIVFSLLTVSATWVRFWFSALFGGHQQDWSRICRQPAILAPPTSALRLQNSSQFLTAKYRERSAELLGGAVRIPTEIFDDMDVDPGREPRFEVFKDFHSYLEKKFPLVSKHLEYVNTYGLLYTIKGASDAKPVVLMAHQDVVPVERNTLDQWTHGAFSGYYDGERIWGRGSQDTKSSLIAILEATESLLKQKWTPQRTVLISFGFDEELDGSRGALQLANTIRERYGEEDSVEMIIDEGSRPMDIDGSIFAFVGVSEKGYTDINIEVNTPGGHSSVPPDHTGIGIASEIVARLEANHIEFNEYRLAKHDIVAQTYGCVARFASDLSRAQRKKYVDVNKLREHLSSSRLTRGLISTTQAVDVIEGGVKVNALPEQVRVVVNYRIDVHQFVADITGGVKEIVESVASHHGLGVELNGQTTYEKTGHGYISITNGQSLEAAPISPYDEDSDHWKFLAGTTKHVLGESFGLHDVTVAPLLVTGNTDTWRYQGISKNIYRYTLGLPGHGGNAHTVDEYTTVDSHLAAVVWYYEMLQFW